MRTSNPTDRSNLLLSYSGVLSGSRIDHLLDAAESQLDQQSVRRATKKKVYNILVETFQNAYHHVDKPSPDQDPDIELSLHKDEAGFTVNASNQVKQTKVRGLKSILDKLNGMSLAELKSHYRNKLKFGYPAAEQGAGLGLADIIRKSGEKISYSFEPVNKDYSYFSLQVKVSE